MTVFVLLLATAYEGEMLLGVYSSLGRAEDASRAWMEDQRSGDPLHGGESFEIRETDLDGVAQYHW